MIPILYEKTETAFTSNGIGRLSDAISCTVTEERNGSYELEMQYPITGQYFDKLTHSRIIYAVPADGKSGQPFRIYRIEKPINGICTIYAEHISYELNHIPVKPFTASTCSEALGKLVINSGQTCPFTVWTNKSVTANYQLQEPRAFRELLGGTRGSILDVYGTGEYEFDKYQIKLYLHRGTDRGVTIRYAKNLVDLVNDENIEDTYTGVCPYWYSSESDTLVMLPEIAIWSNTAENFPYKRTKIVDFSEEWEDAPTVAQLRARTNSYIEENDIGIPKVNIDVKFVPLWQMEGASLGAPQLDLIVPSASVDGDTVSGINGHVEGDTVYLDDAYLKISFQDYKVLERIHLCDTITVVYDALGVNYKAKVIKTVYNVLQDRYDSIEVGEPKTTLASIVTGLDDEIATKTAETGDEITARLQAYVDHQTSLITGGLGGYVVFNYNANGEPQELLVMDTDDMQTATNVIRINKNGIGFSTTGYSGPFTSAWTIDGIFNTDFIGAGSITTAKLAASAVTSAKISSGAITVGKLSEGVANSITTAQSTADGAASAASAAQSTADAANTLAAGKSTVYYSTANPSGSGYKAGDVWVKNVSSGTAGDVMWTYSGSAWVKHEIGTTTIIDGSITTDLLAANAVTAAKIAAGAITAGNISLYGKMGVYKTSALSTNGGYMGYMSGSDGTTTTTGIGIMDSAEKNYVIVTDSGIRATNTSGSTNTEMYLANGVVAFTGTSFRAKGTVRLNYDGSAFSGVTYANEIRMPNNKPISSTNGAGDGSFWMVYSDSSNNTYLGNTSNGTIIRGSSVSCNAGLSVTGSINKYVGSNRVAYISADNNNAGMVSILDSSGNLVASLYRSSSGYGVLALYDATHAPHYLTPSLIDQI